MKILHEVQHKFSDYGVTYPSSYMKNDNNVPKLVSIAPAPDRKYMALQPLDVNKKKYNYKSNPYVGPQAASIARRNARERNRVKQVNDGFNALRKRLPAAVVTALSGGSRRGSGKKLSKVDTLKMVVEYIKYLQNLIDDSDASLGITKETTNAVMKTYFPNDLEDDVFEDRNSPYSEPVSSPDSDYSSGLSSGYCSGNGYLPNNLHTNNVEQINSPMEDDELLDAISWWQHKI